MKMNAKNSSNCSTNSRLLLSHLVICLAVSLVSNYSFAQTRQSQLQCRSKSKEIAKTAYDQCLELAKGDEAENIRKEFRMKFAKLKDYYEKKLKKVAAKAKKDSKAGVIPATADASNTSTKTTSTLPAKTKNEIQANGEKNFNPPPPVNTQEQETFSTAGIDNTPIESSNINAVTADETTSTSSGLSNEPTIQLKEAPKSNSITPPSSTTSDSPTSSFQPTSEKLEVEPDTAI